MPSAKPHRYFEKAEADSDGKEMWESQLETDVGRGRKGNDEEGDELLCLI